MKLADLKAAPYNPRTISQEAAAGLTASLKQFGLVDPLIVNKRTGYTIVGGHQRYAVMQQQGITDAQVVLVDLSEAEERALNVVLNNEHIAGEWNNDALVSLLDQIKSDGAVDFSALRLDELLNQFGQGTKQGDTDPDSIPPVPKKPITKPGDLWKLGDHRLLCGDSSIADNFKRLFNDEKIDLVFSDPPYGIDYGEKNRFLNSFQPFGRNLKDIANDTISKDELLALLTKAFTLAHDYGADHCSYYVTAPQGGELGLMMMMMMMSGLPTRHILIWNKDSQNFSMGRLDYEYKHEPILYTWKKKHRFTGLGKYTNSVWDIPKPKHNDLHPTMKPVELVVNAIQNSSKKGDIVADIFTGSGTTLMAADVTNRIFRGIELDPAYCDVIVKRWEEFSAKKATVEHL